MILHPIDIAFWIILCALEATLALVILKKNAARRWPFLLALSLFDILFIGLLASHAGNYSSYFYVYWYGQGVRSLITLGLIWDVYRALPALKYVPKQIGLVLLSAGATITIGSIFLTTLHHPDTAYPIVNQALLIRECVTVLWMCCAGTLLGSISRLGLGWSLESVNVTAGAVASGIAAMAAASFTSSWPQYGHMIDKSQTCIEIAVFLSWIYTLCRTPLADALLSDSALNAVERAITEPRSYECFKHFTSPGTLGPRPRVDSNAT